MLALLLPWARAGGAGRVWWSQLDQCCSHGPTGIPLQSSFPVGEEGGNPGRWCQRLKCPRCWAARRCLPSKWAKTKACSTSLHFYCPYSHFQPPTRRHFPKTRGGGRREDHQRSYSAGGEITDSRWPQGAKGKINFSLHPLSRVPSPPRPVSVLLKPDRLGRPGWGRGVVSGTPPSAQSSPV